MLLCTQSLKRSLKYIRLVVPWSVDWTVIWYMLRLHCMVTQYFIIWHLTVQVFCAFLHVASPVFSDRLPTEITLICLWYYFTSVFSNYVHYSNKCRPLSGNWMPSIMKYACGSVSIVYKSMQQGWQYFIVQFVIHSPTVEHDLVNNTRTHFWGSHSVSW